MIVADGFAYISLWGEDSIAKVDVSPLDGGDVDGVKVVNTIMLAPDTFPYSLNIDNTRPGFRSVQRDSEHPSN